MLAPEYCGARAAALPDLGRASCRSSEGSEPPTVLAQRFFAWLARPVRIAFLLTTLVVVTPGTGALFTIAAGLTRGRRASIVAALGCTLGVVPHVVAAITGLAALLNASALAFQGLKLLGVGYLLWLAWRTLRDRAPLHVDGGATPRSALVFMAATLLVFVLYGLFAAAMRRQVLGRLRVMAWLRRTFAATSVLLAGRLAVQSR